VKNGVPFDTAFAMDENMRSAAAIMFSEMEGAKFNVEAFAFEEREG
jgi:hypothetical protein